MWFSSLLLRYPTLRRVFNVRANVASVSFISCSIPCFVLDKVTMGIALSLGSIACGLADTSSVRRYRYQDFAIAIPLFFLVAYGTVWVFPHSILFGVSLAVVSFLLFMLSIYTPRLGAIGFAAILLAIYAMLLYHPNQALWQLPTWLTLGAIWYVGWQALAHHFLPNQESKDILDQIYSDLSRKLAVHCKVLIAQNYREHRFVEAAKYRSRTITNISLLKQRLHQQYSAGEDSPALSELTHFEAVAEQILEQTRLMQFSPSVEFQRHQSVFLEALYQEAKKILIYVQRVRPENVSSYPLPEVNFDSFRHWQMAAHCHSEFLAALAFINKLEIVYLQLKTLTETPNKPSLNLSGQNAARFSWQEIGIRFRSQLTFQSHYFRHALRGALCLSVGLLCVRGWHLEFGFWTLMTSLLVLRPNLSTTWTRVLQRITGTVLGLLVVAVLLHLSVPSWVLPWVFAIGAILFFHTSAKRYGFAVFCVTLFVFSAFALNGEGQLIVLPRLENTLLGVALPILFVLLIAPGWQKKAFPQQLLATLRCYQDYLRLLQSNEATTVERQQVLQACVMLDTNLFDHWIGYLGEPKQSRKTAEQILLCCRYSNLILGWITYLHQQNDFALTKESSVILSNCLGDLAGIETKILDHQNAFFDLVGEREGKVYQALSLLAQQSDGLPLCITLSSLSKALKAIQ